MRAKFIVTIWFLLGAISASGALEPIPDSYLLLSRDQSRCLVMSRSVWSNRWTDDAGRTATLPDGRKNDLYTQFPSNGVYRLPDLRPIYFLDWFSRSNRFVVSPDLDALALFNIFALHGNLTNSAVPKPKAIRFFKHGAEVRSYLAADLIENPLALTVPPEEFSSQGFWAWLDSFRRVGQDRLEVVTVRRGLFIRDYDLSFAPGNRLVFDLHTGALLSEERPLARLRRRAALGLLAIVGLGLAVFFFKRSRAAAK
jgi:hypothetical protein